MSGTGPVTRRRRCAMSTALPLDTLHVRTCRKLPASGWQRRTPAPLCWTYRCSVALFDAGTRRPGRVQRRSTCQSRTVQWCRAHLKRESAQVLVVIREMPMHSPATRGRDACSSLRRSPLVAARLRTKGRLSGFDRRDRRTAQGASF